jgi:signal transduction histidine kinase
VPALGPALPEELMDILRLGKSGWVGRSGLAGRELMGFAQVQVAGDEDVHSDITWYVIVAASRRAVVAPVYRLAGAILAGGLVMIALFFVGGWSIAWREIVRPLTALREGARELKRGNLSFRLPPPQRPGSVFRDDELGQLAVEFNRMAGEFEQYVQRLAQQDRLKQQFIDLASHELRTPVTYILGATELAQRRGSIESELLSKIGARASRLNRIVDNMFKLVLSGSYDAGLRLSQVNIDAILRGVCQELHAFLLERHQTCSLDLGSGLPPVIGDAEKLRDVFSNLISNAIRFSPDGALISVRAVAVDGGIEVAVGDQGPGIASADLPYLFSPFFTGSEQVSRHSSGDFGFQTRGAGLGLSIVKRFVEMHAGRVNLDSTPQGTTVRVFLPVGGPGPGDPI